MRLAPEKKSKALHAHVIPPFKVAPQNTAINTRGKGKPPSKGIKSRITRRKLKIHTAWGPPPDSTADNLKSRAEIGPGRQGGFRKGKKRK